MGLVLNPYAYRIGHINSWSDSWYLISAEYSEFLHSSTLLKSFVYYVLYKFYPTRFSFWLISHIEILFFNNNMYIWLYIYEASDKYKITKNIKLFKYGLFKDYRLKSYWLKKKLFDKNPVALIIFTFLRLFGSHIEKYGIVENYVFNNEAREKIASLRQRYGYKWLGIEEILIIRSTLSIFFKSASHFALKNLSTLIKSLFFLPISGHKFSLNKLAGPRVFLFFFSYFMVLIKQWPYYKSIANHFSSKIIFVFLRQTIFYLFFNPFIKNISKFLEYLCSFFGYSSVVRASIITNFSLSAFFIARYIMTAIKNGFNYWDILFPIRKTLTRFMQIRLFDNYVRRKNPLKNTYIRGALSSFNKRINLLVCFILVLKSKLIYNFIYNTSYVYGAYYKILSYNCFLKSKKIRSRYKLLLSHKSHIFKRFFCNKFKAKLFSFLSWRLSLEKVNEIKRLARKPITLLQKEKYNKRRRMKRLEKRSMIDLAIQKAMFLEVNQEFNDKLSRIKSFSCWYSKGRPRFFNTKKIVRAFYNTSSNIPFNNKKRRVLKRWKDSRCLSFLIKLYVIFFAIKFFKIIKPKKRKSKILTKPKKIKYLKRKVFNRPVISLALFKKLFILMRVRFLRRLFCLLFFKRMYYMGGFWFNSFLFYYWKYVFFRRWNLFSIMFNNFFIIKYLKKASLLKRKRRFEFRVLNKKYIKRGYHSSNFFSDRVVDILKSLLVHDDKIAKRNRRFTFKQILKGMPGGLYKDRFFSYKGMPSFILKKTFKDANLNDLNGLNNILSNINSIFFLVNNIKNDLNKNTYFFNVFIFVKFYEVLYYLLLLKLFGLNNSHIDKVITIINKCFYLEFDEFNYIYFIRILNTLKFHIIKYIRPYCYQLINKSEANNKFVMFNFIVKFSDYFTVERGYYINAFQRYFFFLLKSILIRHDKISNLNDACIKRLFLFLDNYWYLGYKLYKPRHSKVFDKFFDIFDSIFSLVILIFRVLFNTVSYDDAYFPLIYSSLLSIAPKKFLIQAYELRWQFLPFFLNSKFESNLSFFDDSSKNLFINTQFVDSFNFIGKDNFFSTIISFRQHFLIFPLRIGNYFDYYNSLIASDNYVLNLHTKIVSDKFLSYSDKIVRNKARDHIKSFLYGFKFHFVGRFTRKQQSASMWFRQGFLPSSSMKAEVDYGLFTIPLRFSACTVKVWLYRGFYSPKRLFTYGKWL